MLFSILFNLSIIFYWNRTHFVMVDGIKNYSNESPIHNWKNSNVMWTFSIFPFGHLLVCAKKKDMECNISIFSKNTFKCFKILQKITYKYPSIESMLAFIYFCLMITSFVHQQKHDQSPDLQKQTQVQQ